MDNKRITGDGSRDHDCEAIASFLRVLAIPLGREIASELRQTVREALACRDSTGVEDLVSQVAVVTAQRDDLAKELAAAELNIQAYRERIAKLECAQPEWIIRERQDHIEKLHREIANPTADTEGLNADLKRTGTCQKCLHWNARTGVCRSKRSLNGNMKVGAGNACGEFVPRVNRRSEIDNE